MSTRRRIALVAAAGIVLGLDTWVVERSGWPTPGVNDVLAVPLLIVALLALFLVPLAVGRWWVVGALLGPGLALLVMQLTGDLVSLDDGTGPAFNYRTVFMLIAVGALMLLLFGVRFAFDDARRSRAEWSEILARDSTPGKD
jgi:hypothetical protein